MPGKVKVRILSGRHLPVMDRSSDTTDAFAEVKLGDTTYKTDVYRKSLNPNWNSEWFRFDVDGIYIQLFHLVLMHQAVLIFAHTLLMILPFSFQFKDRDLQDQPLQIRIMDYDTYSANDAIGKGIKMITFRNLYNTPTTCIKGFPYYI